MTTSSQSTSFGDSVDLDELHRLNLIPNAAQKSSIQRDAVTTSTKISELCSELKELEDRLQRHQLALSSPIRQTPPEILGEIFIYTLQTYPILDYLGRHHLVQLELVCRTWRDAARSNHRLWSGIYVDDSINDSLDLKSITKWLGRSGKVEKSLVFESFRVDCKLWEDQCKTMARCLGKLLASGLNITHFEYHCPGPLCFQNFVDTIRALEPSPGGAQAAWDSVKTLVLQFESRWDIEMPSLSSSDAVFKWLPSNLTSLKLYIPCDNLDTTSLDIPTHISSRLTSFELVSAWGEDFMLDLMYLDWANLEKLTLFVWTFILDDLDEYVPPVLPKVRSLRLRGFNPSTSEFFQILTAPQLADLDIDFEVYQSFGKHTVADILSFVGRSNCKANLRSLTIRHVNIQGVKLIKLLTNLPSLTRLTLTHVRSSEDAIGFFVALLKPGEMLNERKPFLPRLESLELIDFPLGVFLGLFDHIKSGGLRLTKNGQVAQGSPLRNLVVRYTTDRGKGEDEDNGEDEDEDGTEGKEDNSDASEQGRCVPEGPLEGSEMVKELRERYGVFVDVAPYEAGCLE
ncbi:hypothetical protein MD484_g6585, partial [Candolleomyces efflorescens]